MTRPRRKQNGLMKTSPTSDRSLGKTVFAYHERTKHHFKRYARSLGYLDWDNQPHPFRYYDQSTQTQLSLNRAQPPLAYYRLYESNTLPPQTVNLDSLADFFRYSLALSAWKQSESKRWSLRINPSSGNLHPTEAYAVLPAFGGATPTSALYHYVAESHLLEQRTQLPQEVWQALTKSLPKGSFLIGLSSIIWRESWKYGERAFRYCQHDIGHALAALRFAAVLCGWSIFLASSWSTTDLAELIGTDQPDNFHPEEHEEAELMAVVTPNAKETINHLSFPPPAEATLRQIRTTAWYGQANQLSQSHLLWPVIDHVAAAARMPRGVKPAVVDQQSNINMSDGYNMDARKIIFQRRSVLSLDGVSTIERQTFLHMMTRTLPGSHPPWDALYWQPKIHLVLFVHRVIGLRPGIYIWVRNVNKTDLLKSALRNEFLWEKPAYLSAKLPLFLLLDGDYRKAARTLTCHQDIAADGFFSLAMIAEFAEPIQQYGAWFYRNLFWESGVIGQVLYLEAEACGARSTGIGCFFDDPVHDALGLKGNQFQSLYHFTVGMPIEDRRLQSWPVYAPSSR